MLSKKRLHCHVEALNMETLGFDCYRNVHLSNTFAREVEGGAEAERNNVYFMPLQSLHEA